MIGITRILRDKKTSGFFSFIIGMGVVVLMFHKPFAYSQYLSIPIADIEGKRIKNGDKCYTYVSEDVKCS